MSDDRVEISVRKRKGFFGFALGVALYSVVIVIVSPVPPIRDGVLLIMPRYEFPWNYIMPFVTPLIWDSILHFNPYNKSKS